MTDAMTEDSPYRVVQLSRFTQGNRWRTEAFRSYAQPTLIWFTKGQGRITVAGTTRGYGAHNAIFLPAGTMHGFEVHGQVYGSIVHLPVSLAPLLPSEPVHLRFRDAHVQAELTALIDNLQREFDRDLPGRDRALDNHGGLLAVWLERQIAEAPEPEKRQDRSRRLTAAYTALVERDFKSAKTVHDYAASLGITATHLSRVCNASCGRPASAILADRQFFEARRLLRDSKMPVQTIAAELGFATAAYFTRAFHKATGQTPSVFRRGR